MDLATLNAGNKNELAGVTSKDAGHVHDYSNIDAATGNGFTSWAVHPEIPTIKHRHKIVNWVVQLAQSECYPDCVEGVSLHAHELNDDVFLAIRYINRLIRKRMKGLKEVYGDKDKREKEEQLIGQMLLGASQGGMISY